MYMSERISLEELYRQSITFPGPTMHLRALRTALDVVEEELAHACDQATVRLHARHKRDEEFLHPHDRELDLYELEVTITQVFPRVFRGGFLLTLWSVFETVAKRMAVYACQTRGLPPVEPLFRKKNKDGFLQLLKHIYRERLEIDAFPDADEYGQLDQLRHIRNALIHHNGNIAELRGVLKGLTLADYAKLGLSVYENFHEKFFVPEAEFLVRNFSLVESYLLCP